jgi:putative intracellular protease/amidase
MRSRRDLLKLGAGAGVALIAGGAGHGALRHRGMRPVVALLAPGVVALDVVGPMEVLGRLPWARPVYGGSAPGLVPAARGPLKLRADLGADALPAEPWVIVLPGAPDAPPEPAILAWLREAAPHAELVLAVGDGRRWMEAAGLSPDGVRVIGAEGGAAALDAALAGAARLASVEYAQALQLAIEYAPTPPFSAAQVAAASPKLAGAASYRVGILLYEGLTALDAIGPYEVYSRLGGVEITLLGTQRGDVRTDTGALAMHVPLAIAERPLLDLLILPGGSYGTLQLAKNEVVLEFLRQHHREGQRIMTVCTGALVLAQSGLLRDLAATTHWASAGALDKLGARYVAQRAVSHPQLVTAAGVSAGIDASLEEVGRQFGAEAGASVQAALPYAPQPPFHMGDLAHGTAPVIALAREILSRNALGSAVRMNLGF